MLKANITMNGNNSSTEYTIDIGAVLSVERVIQDFTGLTVWMRDRMNKRHVLKDDDFKKMIKVV
jgi:hypothetical protein